MEQFQRLKKDPPISNFAKVKSLKRLQSIVLFYKLLLLTVIIMSGLIAKVENFKVEIETDNRVENNKWHRSKIYGASMCIKGLDRINLIWWFNFRIEPSFASAPAASKNILYFKNCQK